MIESFPRLLRAPFRFVRDYFLALGEHAVYSHAAALSFYVIFSIPPALLGIVALAGMLPVDAWMQAGLDHADGMLTWVYALFIDPVGAASAADATMIGWKPLTDALHGLDQDGIQEHLASFLHKNTPEAVATTVSSFADDVLGNAQPELLTAGFVGVLWSASGVTRQVLRAVNAIHEVRQRPWWRQNLVSLGMTLSLLACGTLFLIALPLTSALVTLVASSETWLSVWRVVFGAAALFVLYSVMQGLYRWAVYAKLRAANTREGVLLVMALWGALVLLLRTWGQAGLDRYSATYGALATIVFMLAWVYALSISLLLGVEWNATRLSQGPLWEVLLGDRAWRYTRRAAERLRFVRGRRDDLPLDSPGSAPAAELAPAGDPAVAAETAPEQNETDDR